jgi:hypothetical protein
MRGRRGGLIVRLTTPRRVHPVESVYGGEGMGWRRRGSADAPAKVPKTARIIYDV